MIDTRLIKKPVALSSELHRSRKLHRGPNDLKQCSAGMNAVFTSLGEFAEVCREYAIVFVPAGEGPDGKPELAPMAVLGLQPGENLMADGDRWAASYVPALLRTYPFALGRVDADTLALCIDDSYEGWSDSEGEPLFEADGKPARITLEMKDYLEQFEADAERARLFCRRLVELELLQNMRFDATLPDGNQLVVDGFFSLDEAKLKALPDATVLELHKNGALALIHAQQISLGHMRRLVERRLARSANA